MTQMPDLTLFTDCSEARLHIEVSGPNGEMLGYIAVNRGEYAAFVREETEGDEKFTRVYAATLRGSTGITEDEQAEHHPKAKQAIWNACQALPVLPQTITVKSADLKPILRIADHALAGQDTPSAASLRREIEALLIEVDCGEDMVLHLPTFSELLQTAQAVQASST